MDEDRSGIQSMSGSLTAAMDRILVDSDWFDVRELCVLEGKQAWTLFIDAVVIYDDGNVLDAIMMATKAALMITTVPAVDVVQPEGENAEAEIVVSDDPMNAKSLPLTHLPLSITLHRIGQTWCLDASKDESFCSIATMILSISHTGKLVSMEKSGLGALSSSALSSAIACAVDVGKSLHQKIDQLVNAQGEADAEGTTGEEEQTTDAMADADH